MKFSIVGTIAGALFVGAAFAHAATITVPDRESLRERIEENINASVNADADAGAQVPVVGDPDTFVPPAVDELPQETPDLSQVRERARDALEAGLSGDLDTSDVGPHVKCVVLAPVGFPIPTFSNECPPGGGTTTPPGGGTTTPPGGTTTLPGGGGEEGGGGDNSGGGGNGGGGGGNGGGGGGNGGEVQGASTGPDFSGGGGDVPGIPDTGAGGELAVRLALLTVSFVAMIAGLPYQRRLTKSL